MLRQSRSATGNSALHQVHRVFVLALALGALSGCGDGGTGPTEVEGVYGLRELNGQPLPYDHAGLGCCTYQSGTLTLGGSGYSIALTAQNRNTGQVFTAREWGKFTQSGSSLTFAPDSFELSGLLLDVATYSIDTVRVALGGDGPGSSDQFQAVFARGP